MPSILSKAFAEFLGTALLVCVVVGSGIMGTNLSQDAGVALIINTISTIFALVLLIFILAPVSGAHFNPAVSLVQLVNREQKLGETLSYILAQTAGAISGAILANVMFDQEIIQISKPPLREALFKKLKIFFLKRALYVEARLFRMEYVHIPRFRQQFKKILR
jgi:glycerol uptake facilitator-like aquaporin